MYSTAYRLIQDCLDWSDQFDGTEVPERFAAMHNAMIRVARFVRTGA